MAQHSLCSKPALTFLLFANMTTWGFPGWLQECWVWSLKSTSNHGDQSPSELELPGPCQQLNRNPLSVNVLLNINSAAIPTETQGHNKNQPLHNSDVPGSETQLQNSDNQIGFLPTPETPRLGALSNHMAGISAQSPVTNVTPPAAASPNILSPPGHQFKDYSTPLQQPLALG